MYETYEEILENFQKVFLGSGSVRLSTMVAGRVGYRHILAFKLVNKNSLQYISSVAARIQKSS